jgi:CDP-diacylglycerol--serine O-phosphatidyltransferase
MAEPPQKRAGFLTGVPAPVGAGLALMPIHLWIASGRDEFRNPPAVALWTVMVAFLMISNTATLGWGHCARAGRSGSNSSACSGWSSRRF